MIEGVKGATLRIKTETKVGLFVVLTLGLFLYGTWYLGMVRFSLGSHRPYTVLFKNLSGLVKKSDIKIAGFKVGWVESIDLIPDGTGTAVVIMIDQRYQLYGNATADVRQEGLLGPKYLEIAPGNADTGQLPAGATLTSWARYPLNLDDLVVKMQKIADNVHEVTQTLKETFGCTQQRDKLKRVIDRVDDIAHHVNEQVLPALQSSADSINAVAQKINDGPLYDDVCFAARGIKQYLEAAQNIGIVVDTHVESMHNRAEHYEHKDSKGYVDVRLHTREDLFYQLQIASSEKGVLRRTENLVEYYDCKNQRLCPPELAQLSCAYTVEPPRTKRIEIWRNAPPRFGLQVGKIFYDAALRVGLFENTFGLGIDYDVPFKNEYVRWLTSLEVFDFKGQLRIDDRRPHVKWLNKLFFKDSIYFVFGIDDFVSKCNSSSFLGFGVRFSDDDIKYVLGKFGIGS